MSVLIYLVLTVAIFALLGWIQKLLALFLLAALLFPEVLVSSTTAGILFSLPGKSDRPLQM
jgi:hypothetical protein